MITLNYPLDIIKDGITKNTWLEYSLRHLAITKCLGVPEKFAQLLLVHEDLQV